MPLQGADHRRHGLKHNGETVFWPACHRHTSGFARQVNYAATRCAIPTGGGDWLPASAGPVCWSLFLALGHQTTAAANRFGVGLGRISQLRRALAESWGSFIGEPAYLDQAARRRCVRDTRPALKATFGGYLR